jgi:phytanoyl-CoA hydroxylase
MSVAISPPKIDRQTRITDAGDLWFDAPDAHARASELEGSAIVDAALASALRNWIDHGYIVLERAIPHDVTEAVAREVDELWTRVHPTPGLRFEELPSADGRSVGLTHAELLDMPVHDRARLLDAKWRIHEYEAFSEAAARLVACCTSLSVVHALMGEHFEVFNTITFRRGSQQPLHQDWAVAHVWPRGSLIGVWVALEDVPEDGGPVAYHPGTHRLSPFAGFDPYPDVSLRTCSEELAREYSDWIETAIAGSVARTFVCRRGDVMIWHSGLIHGGAPIARPGATRRSFVCHLIARGANKERFVDLPANW